MTMPVCAAVYLRVSTGRQADSDRFPFRTNADRPRPIARLAAGRLSATMSSPASLRPMTGIPAHDRRGNHQAVGARCDSGPQLEPATLRRSLAAGQSQAGS
jgi:hypothetical protein